MVRKVLTYTTVLSMVALSVGCSMPKEAEEVNDNKVDKFSVVTSFYPMYLFTNEITKGAENVEVVNMVDIQTGCLHDYSLTTDNMKLIEDSDAFVVNGAGMEQFLDKVIKEDENTNIIDTSTGVELLEGEAHDHNHEEEHEEEAHDHDHEEEHTEEAHDHDHEEEHAEEAHDHNHEEDHAEEAHDHDHEEEHAEEAHDHDHEEDHAEEEHDHNHAFNSHIWLDPENAIIQCENIKNELSKLNPQNKDIYEQNYNKFKEELEKLDDTYHTEIEKLPQKGIITFHDAFLYLANAYDLEVLSTIQREAGSQPSAKQLQETIDIINKEKVSSIFVEPQYPQKTADTIAQETNIEIYTLDPIVTNEDDKTYTEVMYENLENIKKALK